MSRNKSECDRLKAILLSGEGWSEEMIAQALRKHKSSILRHIKEYVSTQKTISLYCDLDRITNQALSFITREMQGSRVFSSVKVPLSTI
ncbi:MAG: helix-turn-helix domain-containing protein [Psychromonas sp.]|nr:helix-turn-helix domain-containing protein [Psychromonas sp.]